MHLLQHILDGGLEATQIKGICPFVQQQYVSFQTPGGC